MQLCIYDIEIVRFLAGDTVISGKGLFDLKIRA
jgi:hypothetical protein